MSHVYIYVYRTFVTTSIVYNIMIYIFRSTYVIEYCRYTCIYIVYYILHIQVHNLRHVLNACRYSNSTYIYYVYCIHNIIIFIKTLRYIHCNIIYSVVTMGYNLQAIICCIATLLLF